MSHRRWHTHTHTHFNHFVSCQERNVSQPRSPLIPVIPSLIRLPLCLPSGSVLPLFPFLSPFLSSSFFFFFFNLNTLTLSLPHTLVSSRWPRLFPEWKCCCCCQTEQDCRNACCFTVTHCFLLTGL